MMSYVRLCRAFARSKASAPSAVRRFAGILMLLFLPLLFAGCGYHIAGKGGKMPGDIKTLSIPVFVNLTSKPEVESALTSAFVTELVTSVGIAELEEAEAVMYGTITSYSLTPVSYTKSDVNQEYRLTVAISVSIVKKDTGTVLWEDPAITDYEDFTVNIADVSATREAEDQALKKLAKDTSRNVKEKLLEGF